jgi:uncharacterized protein YegP (UPF0339 family)
MGFEVFRWHTEWRWRLVGADGIVARGEPCATLDACLEAIRTVQGANAATPIYNYDTGALIGDSAT